MGQRWCLTMKTTSTVKSAASPVPIVWPEALISRRSRQCGEEKATYNVFNSCENLFWHICAHTFQRTLVWCVLKYLFRYHVTNCRLTNNISSIFLPICMNVVYLLILRKMFHMFPRYISICNCRTLSGATVAPALEVRMSAMLLLQIVGSYKFGLLVASVT